jgi:hypothetical protein
MQDLEKLKQMWVRDSQVDDTELGTEALKVPNLHAKYIAILSDAKLVLRKHQSDLYKLRKVKYKYYRGEMTQAELEVMGWEQYLGAKPLKNEMDEFLKTDEDMINKEDRIFYQQTLVDFLEQVIRSINSRGWDIKNAIEWNKFATGVN